MRKPSARSKPRAFFAIPMAGLRGIAAYREHHSFAMEVLAEIEMAKMFTDIYCAAREIASTRQFNDATEALSADYRALLRADVFLMLYSQPVLSSVLVEAGIALGLKKKICIACRRRTDLPFMLRGTAKTRANVPMIAIVEWGKAKPKSSLVSKMLLDCCSQELKIPR